MDGSQPGFFSYLLRIWKVENGDETRFRISIENTATGERKGFTNLEALIAFLHMEMRKAEKA
jgi:hypothetical protein